jgi:hypothetical protein
MSNQNKERLTSPAGLAKYPRLNTPDTKFKKEGQFKVTLQLDASDDAEFISQIESLEKAAAVEAKKNPKNKNLQLSTVIRPSTDKDGDEIDGKVEITFKTTASGVNTKGEAWERKVRMFDAKGKPTEAKVGSGSTLKVAFTYAPYTNPSSKSVGISLYLDAVQIIDLVEFKGQADAGDYGFGEEEGYEAGSESSDGDFKDESNEDESNEDEPEEKPAPKKGAKAPAKVAPKKGKGRGDF